MAIKTGQTIMLLISMFIFTLGFGIIVPVIPYFIRGMGATALDMGLLMAAMSAMQLLFAPLWGKASDRFGRKPVMLIGLLGFGLSFVAVGMATQLWMLYVTQIISGALSAGIFPACLAYIADTTAPGERGKYMGLMGAASGAGMIFGPAISSFFAGWGITIPFFAAAGIGLVTAVFILFFLPESRVKNLSRHALKSKVSVGMVMKGSLAIFFIVMLFSTFAIANLDATFTYLIMDRFGLSETASNMPVLTGAISLSGPAVSGIMFTVMGILMMICQGLLVGKLIDKFGEGMVIFGGLLLVAAGMLVILAAPELISLIVAVCLIAGGASAIFPCMNTLVSKKTDSENQGVMLGLLGSFQSMGRVCGPVVGGAAYVVSAALTCLASAVLAVLCAIVIYVKRGSASAETVESHAA